MLVELSCQTEDEFVFPWTAQRLWHMIFRTFLTEYIPSIIVLLGAESHYRYRCFHLTCETGLQVLHPFSITDCFPVSVFATDPTTLVTPEDLLITQFYFWQVTGTAARYWLVKDLGVVWFNVLRFLLSANVFRDLLIGLWLLFLLWNADSLCCSNIVFLSGAGVYVNSNSFMDFWFLENVQLNQWRWKKSCNHLKPRGKF